MSRITDPDLRVHAILAYCMAAPLGQEAAVSTRCARLLLFDGEPSTPQAIGTEFRSMVESVETAAAPLPPWWKAELLDDRSDTFLKLSEQYLTALVRRNVASDSLWDEDASNEDEIEEATVSLVNTFLDWTAYLVAAYRSDFPAWEGKVTNFLSRSQAIIGSWPGAALTESVRVDSDRTGLLSDESTRRLVLEALEASR
ncbi:hypothetical protein [Streptosporangium nondiastaticum]|uniref:hypothetical protein n=1 Tax=Streptosporangium nondiastaticum TaxID=35764 RepID=UPI0031F7EEBA